MAITKVAILIGGGFFWRRFKYLNRKNPTVSDVNAEITNTMSKVQAKTAGETDDILFRVYYYDCTPFGGTVKDISGNPINYSTKPVYTEKTKFLDDLGKEDRFAIRLGELSFAGWKQKPVKPTTTPTASGTTLSPPIMPDFRQKGVDMKFGLDMAWLATKQIVDKVVLIAGDSDFIAPIKFVRKEGLQVYLNNMGNHVKDDLIKHCDFVI